MDRTEDLGRPGCWDVSKRSPDEPPGRANARPMTGSAISGTFKSVFPAFRGAHAGYLPKAVTIPIQRNTLPIACEPSHT